jgi:hypothetical protein
MDGEPRLVPRRVSGVGLRPCDPHPGLFREFAELKPTKDAIEASRKSMRTSSTAMSHGRAQSARTGRLLTAHHSAPGSKKIGDMRVLVNLSDHIKADPPKVAELKKIIRWTDED